MEKTTLKAKGVAELFDLAVASATQDPILQSDSYWSIIRELHSRPDRLVFDRAVELCANQDPILRAVGADVLAQLGLEKDNYHPFADMSEGVLAILLADVDIRVICSALYALGHLQIGSPIKLANLVTHTSPEVRYALAFALCGRSDEHSLTTLIKLTADEDRDTRDWATFALGTLCEAADSPDIRKALTERLSDEDEEIRGEAMVGLAKRQDKSVIDQILCELQKDDVPILAVDAVCEMPQKAYLPYLEELLAENPDDKTILEAIAKCRSL